MDLQARAAEVVTQVVEQFSAATVELGQQMYHALAEAIPELRGDPAIQELLRASSQSNVEAFFRVVQLGLPIKEVTPPQAASEYGRRLAQRSVSSNALLRAYRLGQQLVQVALTDGVAAAAPDPAVAFEASRMLQGMAFEYVDHVSELVVREYEVERERWLSHRNTVRTVMLRSIVDNEVDDVSVAERSLGYRLRQSHLGIVLWETGQSGGGQLRTLEQATSVVGEAIKAGGQPLFIPQDNAIASAWLPLGRGAPQIDVATIESAVSGISDTLRVATGLPGRDLTGFRESHLQAKRAQAVGALAQADGRQVTSFLEPGVQTAALLTLDMAATRDLVRQNLGDLAVDDEASERLRETLRTFLKHQGSYVATAAEVHLHKNTVKYRVEKALEVAGGRTLDEDRFGLELCLLAAHWLGAAVLVPQQQ